VINVAWSNICKCYVAIDSEDVFLQKKGISEANAIVRAKYTRDDKAKKDKDKGKIRFKLTAADLKAMKAACTP